MWIYKLKIAVAMGIFCSPLQKCNLDMHKHKIYILSHAEIHPSKPAFESTVGAHDSNVKHV